MIRATILAAYLCLSIPALADDSPPPAPRLAVISDTGENDLAALLTAELSSNPSVTLYERDQLAQIGNEAKMQQMASADAPALGKLLGADGLLFLNKRTDGLHARLTAVKLGYAVFDQLVSATADPQQEVKALAHLVEVTAPKLQPGPEPSNPHFGA